MAEAPRIDRRRLLLGVGFAGANLALLRALPGAGVPPPERVLAPLLPAALVGAPPPPADGHRYEVVVAGGRVIDPASGFDALADVGIDGGVVRTIVPREGVAGPGLQGATVVDAAGLVVAPGFIDVLSYDPNPVGIWLKVADGVTTNLGMHGIDGPAADFFAAHAGTSPCHYGGAFDAPWYRSNRLGLSPGETASARQRDELAAMAEQGIADGWIGIDVEPEYTPGADRAEVLALAAVATRTDVPLFVHARYSDNTPPGTNAEALGEIIEAARVTGAGVHVEHIVSTGGTFSMAESLATIQAARDELLSVTACTYPYDFWATYLGSARFDDGWQERFGIGYEDLQLPGERRGLTETTFLAAKADNRLVAAHAIPPADVVTALQAPFVMLGSDAIIEPEANNHPRGAGTFARTLGRYVRDEGVLSLVDALAKMTVLPAERLVARAPAMARKGRVAIGADADLTVFDPATVGDRATIEAPDTPSVGIEWVLVAGQVVKDPSGVRRDVLPGQAIRSG